MQRKERSRSRSASHIRKHIRKNKKLTDNNMNVINDNKSKLNDDSSSEDNSEYKLKINRKKYTITFKKNAVEKFKEIKNNFPKKGLRTIANELNVPRSSLQEWIKQINFLEDTKGGSHKFRLDGGGRNPNTLDLEGNLIVWISEQRRLGIPINTNTIILKLIEIDNNIYFNLFLIIIFKY